MYTFLLILLVLDSVLLITVVLLQAGQGGGLSASFGGASSSPDSFVGTRQAANLLTKSSWWTGGIFLALSLVLTIMSGHTSAPSSVLDQQFGQPVQTAPPASSNSAVPLTPAPTNPAVPLSPAPKPKPPASKK